MRILFRVTEGGAAVLPTGDFPERMVLAMMVAFRADARPATAREPRG